MLSLPSCSYDIRTEFSKNGVGEGCSIDCCSVVMHPAKIGNNSNKRNEARILFKVTFILSHLMACVMPLQGYRVAPLRGALARVMRAGGWDWAPSRRSPGTRQRDFAGTHSKRCKLPDCPQGVRALR